MNHDEQQHRQEEQERVAELMFRQGHAVAPVDRHQIHVYLEADEEMNVWPTSEIEPFEVTGVEGLPEEAHYAARALLKPDWGDEQ